MAHTCDFSNSRRLRQENHISSPAFSLEGTPLHLLYNKRYLYFFTGHRLYISRLKSFIKGTNKAGPRSKGLVPHGYMMCTISDPLCYLVRVSLICHLSPFPMPCIMLYNSSFLRTICKIRRQDHRGMEVSPDST